MGSGFFWSPFYLPTLGQCLAYAEKRSLRRGAFYAPSNRVKNPYRFHRTDGGTMTLACYPDLMLNDCIALDFLRLTAKGVVAIRYFVVHPKNFLLQWLVGSAPNFIMEVEGPQGGGITFRQSVVRLQKWSSEENGSNLSTLPIEALVPLVLTFMGAAHVYGRLKASRKEM